MYAVIDCDFVTPEIAAAAAYAVYHHPDYPWAREQFSLDTYTRLISEETVGDIAILCTLDGVLVGAMSLTDVMEDPHQPGLGVTVCYVFAHQDHPMAAPLMYRRLFKHLRRHGATWYRVGRRISADSVLDEYRRIP